MLADGLAGARFSAAGLQHLGLLATDFVCAAAGRCGVWPLQGGTSSWDCGAGPAAGLFWGLPGQRLDLLALGGRQKQLA